MRQDMSVSLPTYFATTLGKQITKENCVEMCIVSATMLDIFQYGAVPNMKGLYFVWRDFADMYCYSRKILFWHPYRSVVDKVMRAYDLPMLTNKDYLTAIFSELDAAWIEIEEVLTKRGLPQL